MRRSGRAASQAIAVTMCRACLTHRVTRLNRRQPLTWLIIAKRRPLILCTRCSAHNVARLGVIIEAEERVLQVAHTLISTPDRLFWSG